MDEIKNLICEASEKLERYKNRVSFPQIETPNCAFEWFDDWGVRVYDFLEANYGSQVAGDFCDTKSRLSFEEQSFNILIDKLEDCISWLKALK